MLKDAYLSEKRSISVDGKSTTVAMERVYWHLLERLASRQRMQWRDFARMILRCRPSWYKSRAGWLRLYVVGYAYAFLTRPPHVHNPPKINMEWDPQRQLFQFPTKAPYPWVD